MLIVVQPAGEQVVGTIRVLVTVSLRYLGTIRNYLSTSSSRVVLSAGAVGDNPVPIKVQAASSNSAKQAR